MRVCWLVVAAVLAGSVIACTDDDGGDAIPLEATSTEATSTTDSVVILPRNDEPVIVIPDDETTSPLTAPGGRPLVPDPMGPGAPFFEDNPTTTR